MKLYILALKIYYAISIWNYIYNYLKKIWLILKKKMIDEDSNWEFKYKIKFLLNWKHLLK